ncbi:hypothetical protein [Kitasatospora sp. NPDC056184]|uniref:hypothetical protein n=1 Tax=Kitasatospora sp. NPDC056184 TaxID=3345738 RepID=UPI0035D7C3B6
MIAVFLALVITSSVLRPPVDLPTRGMPRALAVLLALLGAAALVGGILALIGTTVAAEWGRLGGERHGGLGRIDRRLSDAPFHLHPGTATDLKTRIGDFVASHRSALLSTALSGARRAVEPVTGPALAVFCSVFLLHSGDRMWTWGCANSRPAPARCGDGRAAPPGTPSRATPAAC